MKITVVAGRDLDPVLMDRWGEIQRQDPRLSSPFFCPEFTAAAAWARPGVYVGIMEQEGRIVGFFPHERLLRFLGRPVAYAVSDSQGVIAAPDVQWEARALVSSCRLRAFEFNHLLVSQDAFRMYHRRQGASPIIDLSQGYESYRKGRREAGSEQLADLERMQRKCEREVGPLRFDAQVDDPAVWERFVRLKTDHDSERGYKCILSIGWIRRLVQRIHQTRTDGFEGMLSALYAGDELAAVHMGMCSKTVWHYWMPAYEPRFARYSPGLILLMRMAQTAPERGLTTIDLGKGKREYKDRLMNRAIGLAEGQVHTSVIGSGFCRCAHWGKRVLQRTRFIRPVRAIYERLLGR